MQEEFDVIGNFTFKYIIQMGKRLILYHILLWKTEFEQSSVILVYLISRAITDPNSLEEIISTA